MPDNQPESANPLEWITTEDMIRELFRRYPTGCAVIWVDDVDKKRERNMGLWNCGYTGALGLADYLKMEVEFQWKLARMAIHQAQVEAAQQQAEQEAVVALPDKFWIQTTLQGIHLNLMNEPPDEPSWGKGNGSVFPGSELERVLRWLDLWKDEQEFLVVMKDRGGASGTAEALLQHWGLEPEE